MRTALTHARDWSCLIAATALILYLTLVRQPAADNRPFAGESGTASTVAKGDRPRSLLVASGMVLPEVGR